MYYIRATGDNRFGGDGTPRWLKIRSLIQSGSKYRVGVKIDGLHKHVDVSEKYSKNLEFAVGWPGLMPVSFYRMIRGIKGV